MIFMAIYACTYSPKQPADTADEFHIERFDRLQYRFLSAGDYSALQQMNISYPTETRTLLENVLKLGMADDRSINERFLKYYQDSTLQKVLSGVSQQYQSLDDVDKQMSKAFDRMKHTFPKMPIPTVYAQIGSLGESIVIGNDYSIGICLDKYLGADFDVYKKYYKDDQRIQMQRKFIVPDCLTFYLISQYPLDDFEHTSQDERDIHISRIHWVVNKLMSTKFYDNPDVDKVEKYMRQNSKLSCEELLSENIVVKGL